MQAIKQPILLSRVNKTDYPSELLEGKTLVGKKLGTWEILKKIKRQDKGTGGHFSVGYTVKNLNGMEGFMKASDIGIMFQDTEDCDPMENLALATNLYTLERAILDVCSGNNMDKVVTAIDHGSTIVSCDSEQQVVFFIIFERAHCDLRSRVNQEFSIDTSTRLKALHNIAVGTQQLHNAKITHNDIKPSNILLFSNNIQKLGDLGRATQTGRPSPFSDMDCPGDKAYASPEQLYRSGASWACTNFNSRKASDAYLIGSLAYFFLTGQMINPIIFSIIENKHLPTNWAGDFEEVLPYWRDAFGLSIFKLKEDVEDTGINRTLISIIQELCEPNPLYRGSAKRLKQGTPSYDLQKYISQFDLLHKRHKIGRST